jgi:hypothetical protein
MIVYDLACAQGHRFEGWFGSADDFDGQKARDLVRCPLCDTPKVERIPSARVNVGKAAPPAAHPQPAPGQQPPTAPASGQAASGPHPMAAGLPAEVVAKLREIVRNTENVGRRFPEEARKMHYEETPPRPIRGQASADEAEALREEGIDFAALPPFLTEDPH